MATNKGASAAAKQSGQVKKPYEVCKSCSSIFGNGEPTHPYSPGAISEYGTVAKPNDRLKYCFQHLLHFEHDLVELWAVWMKTSAASSNDAEVFHAAGIVQALHTLVTRFRGRPFFAAYGLEVLNTLIEKQPRRMDFVDIYVRQGLKAPTLYYVANGLGIEQLHAWRLLDKITRSKGNIQLSHNDVTLVTDAWRAVAFSSQREAKFVTELEISAAWQTDLLRPMLPVEDAKRYAPRLFAICEDLAYQCLAQVFNHTGFDLIKRFAQSDKRILPQLVQSLTTPLPEAYPESQRSSAAAIALNRISNTNMHYIFDPTKELGQYLDWFIDQDPSIAKGLATQLSDIFSNDFGSRYLKLFAGAEKFIFAEKELMPAKAREEHIYKKMAVAPTVSICRLLKNLLGIPRARTLLRNESETFERIAEKLTDLPQTQKEPLKWVMDPADGVESPLSSMLILYKHLFHLQLVPGGSMNMTEQICRYQVVNYKDQGNTRYKAAEYKLASYLYSYCLDLIQYLPGNQAELAILYGNRSQSFFMADAPIEAEMDSLRALLLDPKSQKNQVRLHRARAAIGKTPIPEHAKETLFQLRSEYNALSSTLPDDDVPMLV